MWIFCIPCIINNNSLSNNRHLHLNCVVVIVDHTRFLLTWFPDSLSSSASASVTSYSDVDSDDTIILQRSPASTKREEDSPLAKVSSADFITAFVWKFKQTWKCSDKWQMNESCEIMIISVFLHLIFYGCFKRFSVFFLLLLPLRWLKTFWRTNLVERGSWMSMLGLKV